MFARFCVFFSAFVFALVARSETIVSQSQQFVVHAADKRGPIGAISPGSIEVVPEFLTVTAERVKEAVVTEIPAIAQASTPVHIAIVNSTGPDGVIGIVNSRFADGSRYEMAVPRVVEEIRLIKAFINVLLVQYAHANNNGERPTELPTWVTDGVCEQMLHSVGPTLVVGRAPTAWEVTARDLNFSTREMLRTNTVPDFNGLTTFAMPQRKTPEQSVYLAGTHLLVHSLLHMPNGRQRFANFIRSLPHTWNWQTAFMQSFGFQRMLDVEKWWSLTVVEFTTRDERQAWYPEMSLRKLNDLLRVRIEYRGATNELPETKSVEMKTILGDADTALQGEALSQVILQLGYTSPHMAPPVAAIAMGYKKSLEEYLQKRRGVSVRPGLRATPESQAQAAKTELLKRIAALDEQRRTLAERTIPAAR